MIKYAIILMNMLALLAMQVFFEGDVEITINSPAKVKQGEEFTVTLTVKKGSLSGVGHIKQTLPSGFGNAVAIEAKGAEFKYLVEDNVVKFTWISLPADQEYTVSYKLTVDPSMSNGNVELSGKFSYVLNNQKQTYNIPAQVIMVGEEPLATTTTATEEPKTTDIQPETTVTPPVQPETTGTTAITETTKTSATVTASRTIVGSPEAGMEFTVELIIEKGSLKGFARVQEDLPDGLTAISLINQGGTFSFQEGKMKIIWDNLPAGETVKVSYRVAVGDNVSGDVTITGRFSYVENDDPKKIEIPASVFSIKPKSAPVVTTTSPPTQQETAAVNVPTSEKTINFRVQICALSKIDRSTSYFQSKYSIGKVNMEFHEGWRKYTTGKYSQYRDARDYRETMRSRGVENPFVTAYNNGKRITVQEALMVSNQKWIP